MIVREELKDENIFVKFMQDIRNGSRIQELEVRNMTMVDMVICVYVLDFLRKLIVDK